MRKDEFDKIKQHVKSDDSRFVASRSPFYQTVRMLAQYYARMNTVLKPMGIDHARWRVLSLLVEHEPITVSEIADDCVVNISTMAKTINRMVTEGFVTVRTSSADARSTEVMISDKGRALLDKTREKTAAVFQEALGGLSKTELQVLNSLSARIFENLSQ